MPVSLDIPVEQAGLHSQDYYAQNADKYAASTLDLDLTPLYERFLAYLPKGSLILDAGSGSGRDTLAFLKRGYVVEAFDASPELSAFSSRLTGVPTRVLRFQEFDDVNRYDGIWACASLLHVPKVELHETLVRLILALKFGGALYMSFKHGDDERIAEDGRFYSDVTEEELAALLSAIPDISIEEVWLSEGESRLKGKGDWVNAIVRRLTRKEDV